MSSENLTEPLNASDTIETGSQSSGRSGRASLLERIQAQRQRETEAAAPAPAQQIQVPQYDRVPEGFGNSEPQQEGGFFQTAWNNINASMEDGMSSMHGMDAQEALLSPSTGHYGDEEHYSITNYFLTFVRDIYNMFLALPVWARWILVIVLLYVALRLL